MPSRSCRRRRTGSSRRARMQDPVGAGGCDWQHVALPPAAGAEGRSRDRAPAAPRRHQLGRSWSSRWPATWRGWAGAPACSSPSTAKVTPACTGTDRTSWSSSTPAHRDGRRSKQSERRRCRGRERPRWRLPRRACSGWCTSRAGSPTCRTWTPAWSSTAVPRRIPHGLLHAVLGRSLRGGCWWLLAGAPGRGRGARHRRAGGASTRSPARAWSTSTPGSGRSRRCSALRVGEAGVGAGRGADSARLRRCRAQHLGPADVLRADGGSSTPLRRPPPRHALRWWCSTRPAPERGSRWSRGPRRARSAGGGLRRLRRGHLSRATSGCSSTRRLVDDVVAGVRPVPDDRARRARRDPATGSTWALVTIDPAGTAGRACHHDSCPACGRRAADGGLRPL